MPMWAPKAATLYERPIGRDPVRAAHRPRNNHNHFASHNA